MFCVGDIVVYGAQGLCKVDGIGPLPMKFADKSKRYYTLHTCKQPSMTIYAPVDNQTCLLYTSPSPRDRQKSRMPSSA